jgi:hypothetical protein
MAMSQSERIRHIQEQAIQYISRSKVRDSSELTHIRQAQASSTQIPDTVADIQDSPDILSVGVRPRQVVITGKGTNMEYIEVLQSAEHAAICGDQQTLQGAILGTYVPSPCIDRNKPPFAQQDLTGSVYIPACKPAEGQYFPKKITCPYTRVPYPSG